MMKQLKLNLDELTCSVSSLPFHVHWDCDARTTMRNEEDDQWVCWCRSTRVDGEGIARRHRGKYTWPKTCTILLNEERERERKSWWCWWASWTWITLSLQRLKTKKRNHPEWEDHIEFKGSKDGTRSRIFSFTSNSREFEFSFLLSLFP